MKKTQAPSRRARRFYAALARAFQGHRIKSLVAWAEQFVQLPGSARSQRFDSSITPWTREPIERVNDGVTRHETYVKPVQSGGSVVGEIAMDFWVSTATGGDIQYNWEDDDKADARYDKRIERILRSCEPVMERWPLDRHKAQKGLIIFPHLNLMVQGVFTEKRVSSDSIRFQINEEIHSWKPGRLAQAYNRTTAFWNSFTLDISNASIKGDQLHQAFLAGSQQHWEVLCPGCGLYHVMHDRWDEKRPDLGGLRYDASTARRDDGSYDYNRIEPTIRYQMPCGCPIHEDARERRSLSLSGRYGEPHNKGAHVSKRSHTLEAVSVDYIPWVKLIEEKHVALKALKYGDPEPLKRFNQERCCRFWDPEERPLVERIVVNTQLRKNREGLKGHELFDSRLFALDHQRGRVSEGEFPHWWLVIRDALSNGDSRLVFEGKIETDEGAIAVLDEHECIRSLGAADSGDDTMHVYQFCLRYGINAIKGGKEAWYPHRIPDPDDPEKFITVKRIYSDPTNAFLHAHLGRDPTCENRADEPRFWLYSKAGVRQRLDWLRSGGAVKWEVPDDVSEDYHKHFANEELVEEVDKRGQVQMAYHQHAKRIDLRVCEAYISMLMEMRGLIGHSLAALQPLQDNSTE